MQQRLLDDRGGINLVKILMYTAFAALLYFAWVYVPPYLDYYGMRNAVRTACNVAYGQRNVDAVQQTILNGFKERAIEDEELGVDGAVIRRAMPYGTELFDVRITEMPPAVSVDLSYEQKIVLPLVKKPRTIRFNFRHTEDLSNIKY